MTTIREHCERGILLDFVKKHWEEHKGQVPLCCFETRAVGSSFLITCTWLKKWYTMEEFTKLCLECQKVIQQKITEAAGLYSTPSSDKEDSDE